MPLPDQSFSFHLEEYKSLKSEVLERLKNIEQLERFTLIGVGATYAWLFSADLCDPQKLLHRYIFWMPPVLFIIIGIRSSYILNKVIFIGHYIREIKNAFKLSSLEGWENRLFDVRDNSEFDMQRLSPKSAISRNLYALSYYGALAIGSSILAWVVLRQDAFCIVL